MKIETRPDSASPIPSDPVRTDPVSANAGARPSLDDEQREEIIAWSVFGFLTLVLIWGYWPALTDVSFSWGDPQYSHGYLIPIFAAVLMWMRYEKIGQVSPAARWAGVGLLVGSLLVRLVVSYFSFATVNNLTFVPCLAGIVLIVGGWRMFRWAGPAVGFLVFMLPWPTFMTREILNPLQTLAAYISTNGLQTLGIDVYREGNHIIGANVRMNVADACSGLRMTTIFMALSVAIILITTRPWWERIVILASALPVAITVNVIRIIITGMCYQWQPAGSELADVIFHDIAGYIMMPMALGLMYLEFVILSNLFIEVEPQQQARFGGGSGGVPHPV